MKDVEFPYITSARKSPDFLVIETWVSVLRRQFYNKRCITGRQGVERFFNIWRELNFEKINETIDSYPARLHECRRVEGRATKY